MRLTFRFVYLFLVVLMGCATPQMPTGGAEDTLPPEILSAHPPNNSLNVQPKIVEFRFSEFVNAGSFQKAFSISPPPQKPPEIKWKGKKVQIVLDSLKANTTYVFKMDAGFSDIHNVALKTPLLYAFSTGNQIDLGILKGEIQNIRDHRPVAGITVGLYRSSEVPDFTTKTDESGGFIFEYLPVDSFYVAALNDFNRNKKADEGDEFGVLGKKVAPDSVAKHQIWAGQLDTVAPQIQRLQMSFDKQFTLQFKEKVLAIAPFQVVDSLGVEREVSYTQYPQSPREIRFFADNPLPKGKYTLIGAVQDSVANIAKTFSLQIPNAKADTTQSRFQRFYPQDGRLKAGERAKVLFSGKMPSQNIAVTDTSGVPIAFSLEPESYSVIAKAQDFKITLKLANGKDTTQTFKQEIGTSAINGKMKEMNFVQLLDESHKVLQQQAIRNEVFNFMGLTAGKYRLRFFEKSANGIFQIGNFPFGSSEKIQFSDWIEVPANWEVEWKSE